MTYTVDEILQYCNENLQSWEREELADKLIPGDVIYSRIRQMSADKLAEISDYYVSEDEPDADDFELYDYHTDSLVRELIERGEIEVLLEQIDKKDHYTFVDYIKENML